MELVEGRAICLSGCGRRVAGRLRGESPQPAGPRALLFGRRSPEFAIQTIVNVKVITAQKTLYIRVNYKEILEYN